MQTEFTIRKATRDDNSAVCRLLRELDEHHVRVRADVFQPFDDPSHQRDRVTQFIDDETAELFVAEINRDIVGLATVRLAKNPDAPMFRPGRHALMENLVVDRKFQRSGIGKALLDRITEWTRSRNLQHIEISVWIDNDAGLSFFTSNGFAPRCQRMELRIGSTT